MKEILIEILKDKENRQKLVYKFEDELLNSKEENEILYELHEDLVYYVQNEKHRKEDHSYFGDEKLEELILQALKDLEAAGL
jgi:hypothetical protein